MNRRIIGGKETGVNQYPWYVYLNGQKSDGQWGSCGASLITDRHVITNAHCIAKMTDVKKLGVYLGQHTKNFDAQKALPVKTYYTHPQWKGANGEPHANMQGNDIAIIELVSPLKFNGTFGPVCLPDSNFGDQLGRLTAIGLGYQRDQNNKLVTAKVIHDVEMQQEDCKNIFVLDCKGSCWTDTKRRAEQEKRTAREIICAKGTDARGKNGVCMGDSGGPVVVRRNGKVYLVGLPTAASCETQVDHILSGMTRVSFYANNFIAQNIKNGNVCQS